MTPSRDTGLRFIAYGGGHQSSALCVLAAQGVIEADAAVFANVGSDSERQATIDYVRDVMTPWAGERGLPVYMIDKLNRRGEPVTLRSKLMRDGQRSIDIPVRGPRTGAPGNRSCTVEFKIKVLSKWAKENGATPEAPFTKLIGFSTDEFERASGRQSSPHELVEYPLLKPLKMDRSACTQLIRDVGLPVPPKSSCTFCPFHTPRHWAEMRRDRPAEFADSVHIEATLNARRAAQSCAASVERAYRVETHADDNLDLYEVEVPITPGQQAMCPRCEEWLVVDPCGNWPEHNKGPMYLTRFGKPLAEAIPEAQPALFDADADEYGGCDDGGCFT